jgi:prepilin-type N-terminal cleavage/methylation domain-containing protein
MTVGARTITCARRYAFTLIETLVAVAILAVLATAVVATFSGPTARAREAEAVEQVKFLDATTRDFARRFGRSCEVAFDLSEGSMERREGLSREAAYRATIASPVKIEAVRTARQTVEHDEARVALSPLGLSETYAVELSGPDGWRAWVVFSGLSGEATLVSDESKIEAIFAQVASRRDAD